MGNTYFRNSKSGREQKDHSIIHPTIEVSVQCYTVRNVGANTWLQGGMGRRGQNR